MSNAELTASDLPAAATPTSLSAHDIEGFLAWRLVRTGREVERALTDSIAEHDLTTTQFGVLSLLATGADFTQSDLARAVLVRPQSVGPLITSLTQRGLITRRGPGGRGRRVHFDLTPVGHHLIEHAWPRVTALHSPARLGLDEDDARTLDRLLHTLETAGNELGI
jgi:DNA-binding MarR family transcriptional regulator